MSFLLAWDYHPRHGAFFELPLDIMEYDNVAIGIITTGDAPVTGKLYETKLPLTLTYKRQPRMGFR